MSYLVDIYNRLHAGQNIIKPKYSVQRISPATCSLYITLFAYFEFKQFVIISEIVYSIYTLKKIAIFIPARRIFYVFKFF